VRSTTVTFAGRLWDLELASGVQSCRAGKGESVNTVNSFALRAV
jgi:hypothetical protein